MTTSARTAEKIKKHIYQQQLPDTRTNLKAVTTTDHVTQVSLETCRCIHLQECLPHILDLELCKAIHNPRGWVVANPVHSLHLESQLEDSSPASDHWKHPPILYGEEQQRTDALHTEGVVERWCPLDGYSAVIHDDTALDKMEHLPTLAGMHTRPPSSPSRHPPSPSRVKANATKSADPVPLSSPQHPPKPPVAKSASNVSTVTAATTTTESSNPPLIPSSSTAQPPSVPLPNPPSPSIAKSSDPTTTTAEPPKDAAAEPSKDAAADPPKDGAADPPKDAAADPPKDATVEPIKDAATEPPKDAATEPPKDAATDKDATVEPPTGAATESSKVAEAAMTDAELPKDEATDNNATAEPPTDAVPPSTAPADTAMTDAELPKDEATDNSATAEPPNDAFPSPTAPADAAMTDAAQSPPPKAAAAPTTPEKVLSEAAPSVASSSLFQPCYELSDQQFNHLRLEEDRIRLIRASLSSHRLNQQKKKTDAKKSKRKRDSSSDVCKVQGIPGWRASEPKELNPEQEAEWKYAMAHAKETVERWVEHYRLCRESYWDERELLLSSSEKKEPLPRSGMYFPEDPKEQLRCCQLCTAKPKGDKHWDVHTPNKGRRRLIGDDLMQCLECSFVGCAPQSISRDSRQHMLQHLLVSGHKFAVTCGERAQLFCFRCGDFVYHEVFQQEKERIDFCRQVPFMAWKGYAIQRSFDPFHFLQTKDHGIVWRGLIATYPPLVPKEHRIAAQLTSRRQALFEGRINEEWLLSRPNAVSFSAYQHVLDETVRYKISAPVGMYNLGNTCFKSAILQCLVHCKPLQKHFLKDSGHHHQSCRIYREKKHRISKKKMTNGNSNTKDQKGASVCLACEMDRLFVSYYGSTIGKDIFAAIEEASQSLLKVKNAAEPVEPKEIEKGCPLIISDFLTATWKSGGMDHLAGYEQRDAQEFLNSFLDMLGKNIVQHRGRVYDSLTAFKADSAMIPKASKAEDDIVKQTFEGVLRSVLVCEECGGKRVHNEEFMNISLTLSEEVERLQAENDASCKEISVETCLEHFILPEMLGDGVDCPTCRRKTPTKKQHTFSKLPKVLCLHLKRFDAARNKKIDDFVSFPARGLNMGKFLSHWSEVSAVSSSGMEETAFQAEPQVRYDLYATVNHHGNMQSGHYTTNIKVDGMWYHCNDANIVKAGMDDGEEAVLKNESARGAYLLFYTRR